MESLSPARPETSRVAPGWSWAGAVVVLLLAIAPAAVRLPGHHEPLEAAWHLSLATVHVALLVALLAALVGRLGAGSARRARRVGALGLGLLAAYAATDARALALAGAHLAAGGWRILTPEGLAFHDVGLDDAAEVALIAVAGALLGSRLAPLAPARRRLGALLALEAALALASAGARFYGVRPLVGTGRVLPLGLTVDLSRVLGRLAGRTPLAIDEDRLFPPLDPRLVTYRTLRPLPWPVQAARRPDILLVMVSGLRADALEQMPHLRALAEQGFVAERHHSSGNCGYLGSFSLLTGLDPLFWGAEAPWRAPQGLGAFLSLGYRLELPVHRLMNSGAFEQFVPPGGRATLRPAPGPLRGYLRDRAVVDWARGWLAMSRPEPGLAVLGLESPLYPFNAPGLPVYCGSEFGDSWDYRELVGPMRERYRAALAALDEQLGRLSEALADAPDAVLVVVGVHGEAFGEHGVLGHGSRLDPEQVRVPLVMRLPGEPHRAYAGLSANQDVLPTLLGYLGASPLPERGGQGRDLRQPGEGTPVISACGTAVAEGHAMLLDGLRLDFTQDRRGVHLISATGWDGLPAEPPPDAQARLEQRLAAYRPLLEPNRHP